MKHVICGMGEVGSAIAQVIRESGQEVACHDPAKGCYAESPADVLHICFPWDSDVFAGIVQYYVGMFDVILTIIHSTVPVGTTRKIGGHVVHSPVHGVHPNLVDGLKKFPKAIGGITSEDRLFAKDVISGMGLTPTVMRSPETTEMLKIMCTTQYAWNVILCKEIAAECEKLGVPFEEVYKWWNAEYNRGYTELGKPEVARPILNPMPGPIGGHCLIPNAKLLPCWLTETILKRNEDYKGESK